MCCAPSTTSCTVHFRSHGADGRRYTPFVYPAACMVPVHASAADVGYPLQPPPTRQLSQKRCCRRQHRVAVKIPHRRHRGHHVWCRRQRMLRLQAATEYGPSSRAHRFLLIGLQSAFALLNVHVLIIGSHARSYVFVRSTEFSGLSTSAACADEVHDARSARDRPDTPYTGRAGSLYVHLRWASLSASRTCASTPSLRKLSQAPSSRQVPLTCLRRNHRPHSLVCCHLFALHTAERESWIELGLLHDRARPKAGSCAENSPGALRSPSTQLELCHLCVCAAVADGAMTQAHQWRRFSSAASATPT